MSSRSPYYQRVMAELKEQHPDWTGRIEIDGRPYRVAAWDRSGRTGVRLLSLSITPDTEKEHG